jgi:hypothetical protein
MDIDEGGISRPSSPKRVDTQESLEVRRQAKRSRKTTDRFAGVSPVQSKEPVKRSVDSSGNGTKLGDITKIAEKLGKLPSKDDALKRLHRVLFGTDGTATTRKREIRLWNGTGSDETKSAMENALSGAKSVAMLKDICSTLNLATGGDRASLEERIVDFLVKPTGSTIATKKKKKQKSVSKKNKGKSETGGGEGFSAFLNKRFPEIKHQAEGSMTARDITELLTLEWKNMSSNEREIFSGKKISGVSSPSPAKAAWSSGESSGTSDSPNSSASSSSDSSDSSESSGDLN